MFVFGGRNQDDCNDLHYFNPETHKWTLISCGGCPMPRRRHSSAFIGRFLFVFGGFDGSFYNDLHAINVYPF
jgi:Galactose oxidase, central domain